MSGGRHFGVVGDGMDRRRLSFIGMWVAAIAAVLVFYWAEEAQPDPRMRTDSATVHGPDDLTDTEAPSARPAAPEASAPGQFRYDRRHTGRSSHVGPASSSLAFRFGTGGPITAQPVVDDEGAIYIGSHDHHFYAISADGTQRWRRDLGGPIYGAAALADGRVYVGSDANFFFALDARTGAVVWHLRTDDDADTGVAIAPDGTLVFGSGSDVLAVSREGELRWRFRTGLKVFSTPAIDDDGTIYVGSEDDHLYAIAPDGRMRWRFRTRDDVDSSPAIGDDGTLYFGSDDQHVYALHRDGTLRWSTPVEGDVRAPVGLGEGVIYVGVFGPRPRVVALDATTGTERWSFATSGGESTGNVSSGPLVDHEGDIYFGADDDFVYSLDSSGRMRWFYETGGNIDSEPVITPSGMLLIGSNDHSLYALRNGAIE